MRIKISFLLMCLVIFCLISNVSASDLSEADIMQVDDGLELDDISNVDVRDSDSSHVFDDLVSVESLDEDEGSVEMESLDDSLFVGSQDNVLDDSLEMESLDDSIIAFDSSNSNVPNGLATDEEESALKDSFIQLKNNLGVDNTNKNPLYGVVDFGSNTIHMEIYELKNSGVIKSVLEVSETSVTAAYLKDNKLTQKGIDQLIDYFDDFIDIMDFMDVNTRFFFATASLRKIDNCEEVLTAVKEQLGVDINLISGEAEANYSFNSVKDNELVTDDGLIIDLGGGSCEVIDFIDKTPVTMESMPIGSFSLYNEYVSTMFPDESEILEIRNRVLDELAMLEVDKTVSRTDLYGIGGSIKTIRKVLVYLDYIDDAERSAPVSLLDDLLDEFKDNSREDYYKILNVNSDRVNTFVPGLVVTKTICDYFGIETLHFCKNGIREGIAQELVYNDSKKQDSQMDASDVIAYPNEEIVIPVSFEKDVTGEISLKIGKIVISDSIVNGTALIRLPHLDCGNYSAKISYGGDENYLSNSLKIKISVKSVVLSIDDMIRGYNSSYDYQAKLIDDEGNPVVGKLILFAVGEINYYAMTDAKGIAKINPGLKVGTYKVSASSPLIDKGISRTLKIVKRIENNRNMDLYYNSNQKYKLRIIGDDGKAETVGKIVKVIVDKKTYTYKTDKDGFITIKISKNFKVAKHTIKVQYKGYMVSNTVNVKHALRSKKLFRVKRAAKRIVLKAKFVSKNKKLVKGKRIKFKIKGKTYLA